MWVHIPRNTAPRVEDDNPSAALL